MKRGLNFSDVNTLKLGLQSGWSYETIARECHTAPDVIARYVASMPEDDVTLLKAQAPADGVDLTVLKEQIKEELMREMTPDVEKAQESEATAASTQPQEEQLSPQQRAANTRKANREAAVAG